jgi:hypothetical protein
MAGFVFMSIKCIYLHTFLFAQKSNKKGHQKTITSRFLDCSLIWLLYYCDISF